MPVLLGAAVGVLLSVAAAVVYHVVKNAIGDMQSKANFEARIHADQVVGQIFSNVFWPTVDELTKRIEELEKNTDATAE